MNEWRGKIVWLSGVDKFCVWLHLSTLNSGFSVSREPRWEGESVDKQVSPQDTREQFTVFYTCWGNSFQKKKRRRRRRREEKKPIGNGWALVVFFSRSVRENSQKPVYKSMSLNTGFLFSKNFHSASFSAPSPTEYLIVRMNILCFHLVHFLLWRKWRGFPASFLLAFSSLFSFSRCPRGAPQVSVLLHAFYL